MAKCTESDLAALQEAGPLLRFAAERVKDLDPGLALSIADAQAAAADDRWTPKVAQRFWQAFAKLCDLILPATLDSLAAARATIAPSRWRRWLGGEHESIGQRSSRRYLSCMFVLLLLFILPIQLYVWTCTNLSKKIDDLLSQVNTKYTSLQQSFIRIDADTSGKTTAPWATDKIAADSKSIIDDLDHIHTEAHYLERASTLGLGKNFSRCESQNSSQAPSNEPSQSQSKGAASAQSQNNGGCSDVVASQSFPPCNGNSLCEAYQNAGDQLSTTRNYVQKIEEKASLFVGILGAYILPILFGTIGAIAYVIRAISDQIRTSTFAMNSPTRHFMRAGLGAMAGLVVGLFTDLSSALSLSPLAIAFLAGYGVEAVFSMFDGLIERFKQTKATTAPELRPEPAHGN
jgi:hypothetical protein